MLQVQVNSSEDARRQEIIFLYFVGSLPLHSLHSLCGKMVATEECQFVLRISGEGQTHGIIFLPHPINLSNHIPSDSHLLIQHPLSAFPAAQLKLDVLSMLYHHSVRVTFAAPHPQELSMRMIPLFATKPVAGCPVDPMIPETVRTSFRLAV
jgi:hypothetical protein